MSKATLIINNFDHVLTIEPRDMSNMIDHVPAMVYKAVIKDKIILIKDRPTFTLPKKRYGRHNKYFQQISSAYAKEGPAMGVLMRGEKGSGKSLLAEEIGNWAIKQDIPVVMVSTPMSADALGLVIRAIGPCIVYFDEFGKVYEDDEARNQLLPLFSDTSLVGVMFIVTGNDSHEFSDYMYLRPQRFRYQVVFHEAIDEETVEDILDAHDVPTQFHEVLRFYASSAEVNFDSMLCVVREALSSQDVDELRERANILNVPDIPAMDWGIEEITPLDTLPDGFVHQVVIYKGSYLELHERSPDSSEPPVATKVAIRMEQLVDGRLDLIVHGQHRYRVLLTYGYNRLPSSHIGRTGPDPIPSPSNPHVPGRGRYGMSARATGEGNGPGQFRDSGPAYGPAAGSGMPLPNHRF